MANPNTMYQVTYRGEYVGLVAASTTAAAIQQSISMLQSLNHYRGQVIDPNQITVDNRNHNKFKHML